MPKKRRMTKTTFINAFKEREFRVSHKYANQVVGDYKKLLEDLNATCKKRGI
jgi:hypothetical protein